MRENSSNNIVVIVLIVIIIVVIIIILSLSNLFRVQVMQEDFLTAKPRKLHDKVDNKCSDRSCNKSDTKHKVMLIIKASELDIWVQN